MKANPRNLRLTSPPSLRPAAAPLRTLAFALALAMALAVAGCARYHRAAQPRNVLFHYDGVRFLTPAALGITMRVEELPRLLWLPPDGPLDGVGPAHMTVMMLDYDANLAAVTGQKTSGHRPAYLYFYPARDPAVEDFARVYPPIAQAIERMHALLQAPFLELPKSVPVLPWTDTLPALQARCHRLRFQGGEGFAFLTRPGGAAPEPHQDDLMYVFQGLTDDGLVYVSCQFPVLAPQPLESPAPPSDAEEPENNEPPAPLVNIGLGDAATLRPEAHPTTQTAAANPMAWQAEDTSQTETAQPLTGAQLRRREEVVSLEVLSADDFVPNLETLDSLFRSIGVDVTAP